MSASERARLGRLGKGWEPAKPHLEREFLTFLTFPTWSLARAQARACRRMHPQARASARPRVSVSISTFGRLGRLGRATWDQASRLPNLFPTSERLGTMSVDIDQLRRDLRLTAAREGWADEVVLEIGARIRAALEAGDEETLSYWAQELAWWRELLSSYAFRLRAFEAGVRAQRDQRTGAEAAEARGPA